MWKALSNVQIPIDNDGILFIGLYNDEGFMSEIWRKIKQIYCSGMLGKIVTTGIYFPYNFLKYFTADTLRLQNPIKRYTEYKKKRGMSIFHDWIDWLGGYLYEVAKPGDIFDYFRNNNFSLIKLKTDIGHGINQFVFKK